MWEFVVAAASRATVFDWTALGVATLLLLYVVGTWNYDFFEKRGIASSKPLLPFLGDNLSGFLGLTTFPDLLRQMYEDSKGHAIYGMFQFTTPFYLVRDPELLKHVTVKDFDHFMDHRDIVQGEDDPIFSKNLFLLKGERWREMRATLSPAFTSSKIKGIFPLVGQCAQQMVDHLRRELRQAERASGKNPLEVDMKNLYSRMANDVIATVAFGLKCDSLKEPENEFYKQGKAMTTFSVKQMATFIFYLVIPKIMKALNFRVFDQKAITFLDSLVHETIHERQEKNIFRPDMLQLLMQARDGQLKIEEDDTHETEKTGAEKHKLTNEDISGQAVIFFFAGFETVSTALCFTSYALSFHPEIQKRLQEEIDLMMKENGRKPTYEAVQGLQYLDAVIHETLRMYPPVFNLDRECMEDVTLPATDTSPQVSIKKGDSIVVSTIGMHHDPEYWPDPNKFDPERFSAKNRASIRPFTYCPFGLGPRLCIGQRLALVEVKLALIYLLDNFYLQPASKSKYPLKYAKGFNTNIQGGFWCKIVPREDA